MSKSEENDRKTISIARYCICYKTYFASLGQILEVVSVATLMPSNIVLRNKIICMTKITYVVSTPTSHAILNNRVYLQNYSYSNNRIPLNTKIGLIVMYKLNNLTLIPNI